jgi:hypothetical protein
MTAWIVNHLTATALTVNGIVTIAILVVMLRSYANIKKMLASHGERIARLEGKTDTDRVDDE